MKQRYTAKGIASLLLAADECGAFAREGNGSLGDLIDNLQNASMSLAMDADETGSRLSLNRSEALGDIAGWLEDLANSQESSQA